MELSKNLILVLLLFFYPVPTSVTQIATSKISSECGTPEELRGPTKVFVETVCDLKL